MQPALGHPTRLTFLTLIVCCLVGLDSLVPKPTAEAQDVASLDRSLAKAMTLAASFDHGMDADFAVGDRRIFTAPTLQRESFQPGVQVPGVALAEGKGVSGHALAFGEKTKEVAFYRGAGNIPYAADSFDLSISFWLKLSPNEDLPPGFVDPLQLTDKKWNDAAIWVDFSDQLPRQFRLGAFADFKFWNPEETPWEQIEEARRPMIPVKTPPFTRDRWSHVVLVFSRLNDPRESALCQLYLDGKSQGSLVRKQKFSWDPERLALMLGIHYVGLMDELAVFSVALTPEQVQRLGTLPSGLTGLVRQRETP